MVASHTAEKINAFQKFPKPQSIAELQRFLGMLNFYRKYLRNAATIQAPLHIFLKNSRKKDKHVIEWTVEAETAFKNSKAELAKATLLVHPSADMRTRLITNASDFAMGAVLEQYLNSWKPLAFF